MATKKAKSTAKKTVKKPVVAKSKAITLKTIMANIKKVLTCKCVDNGKKSMPSAGALVAEFIGTFLLIGSIFAFSNQPIPVAFAIIGIVLIIAGVSKAHINPAITIGSWVTRKICSVCAVSYLATQALGASAAFLVLSAFLDSAKTTATSIYSSTPTLFQATTLPTDKEWLVLFAELIGSFIVALGVAKAIKSTRIVYAVTYGFAALVALTIAGSLVIMATQSNDTLTFLNPALAITANAVKWDMWTVSIYLLIPAISAIAGFALNDLLKDNTCDCKDGSCNC